MRLGPVAALAALWLALGAGSARAGFDTCPPDTVTIPGVGTFTHTGARFDTTSGQNHAAYDHVLGQVVMDQCCSLGGVTIDSPDAFDVAGVPAGTPVSLIVTLIVDGRVWTNGCGGTGCGGFYKAWIWHGAVNVNVSHADLLFTGQATHHDVIQLPVTIVAGTPEPIEVQVAGARSPGGNHGSDATALLGFTGLPAGATVISCEGYAAGATPSKHSSWGSVKTLYR